MEKNVIAFPDLKKKISQLIKVIGVGGAGSNAVNYMFEQETLKHVDYIVCNTDLQALNDSPVPLKIQIGKELTGGLGAGSKPETGKHAAEENIKEIEEILKDKTKMLFITAGMGGGTGTGAAPEIAKLAKKLGILTVAIVTMPFRYEGPLRLKSAQEGIRELRDHVDSLLIVDNEKLIGVYGDLPITEAFHKSDEVLANAVKSVSQVIVSNYHINVDFNDVETILRGSGTALIGTATASGKGRAEKVIEKALDSPLLNDNNIEGAKNVLLLIISGTQEATVKEIEFINRYIQQKAGKNVNIIMGLGKEPALEKNIRVTLIATGFPIEKQKEIEESTPELIISVKTSKDDEIDENFLEIHENIPDDTMTSVREDVSNETETKAIVEEINLTDQSNGTGNTENDNNPEMNAKEDRELDLFSGMWEKEKPASKQHAKKVNIKVTEPESPAHLTQTNEEKKYTGRNLKNAIQTSVARKQTSAKRNHPRPVRKKLNKSDLSSDILSKLDKYTYKFIHGNNLPPEEKPKNEENS